MIFFNLNSNCSNLLDLRNLQEKVKKAFCYQKLSWPFTVWITCSSDLKKFANSQPSASNFQSFSRSLEHFFLTVGQNNLGNKISLYNNSSLTKHGSQMKAATPRPFRWTSTNAWSTLSAHLLATHWSRSSPVN